MCSGPTSRRSARGSQSRGRCFSELFVLRPIDGEHRDAFVTLIPRRRGIQEDAFGRQAGNQVVFPAALVFDQSEVGACPVLTVGGFIVAGVALAGRVDARCPQPVSLAVLEQGLDRDGSGLPRAFLGNDVAAAFGGLSGNANSARRVARLEMRVPVANVGIAIGGYAMTLIIQPVETARMDVLPVGEHDPAAKHLVRLARDLLTDHVVDR